jgi:2-amino-4-hydroxy-6-hydroxymethyldihydropteridine diphosphokinase
MSAAPRRTAHVGLGSNLLDPAAQVERALAALDGLAGTRVLRRSRLYGCAPWGVLEQPEFVNAAARIETALAPQDLLRALLDIERRAGRDRARGERWGPRVLDLDLLDYDGSTLAEPGLSVPHPRLHERAFVLVPLAEIAADLVIPGRGRVADLVARVDASQCRALVAA